MTDTKSLASEKINAAIKGCDEVHKHLILASDELKKNVSTNGFGIYHDRSEIRNIIVTSKTELEHALKNLEAIDWPSNNDYDQI